MLASNFPVALQKGKMCTFYDDDGHHMTDDLFVPE
jgi:hypothetical protein